MIDMEELDRDPWSTYPVSKDELRKIQDVLTKLIDRVETLERALDFYAAEAHWDKHPFEPSRIDMDNGRTARRILYGEDR